MAEEQYELTWDNNQISLADITGEFSKAPGDRSWEEIFDRCELCDWESINNDMKRASSKFPGTLFKLEIMDYDTRQRWIQYHRDGLYYQANEVSYLPDFDESLLR